MYLVDGTGATVAAYEYDPYGNIISATGEMAEINPLRYRGYYYDAELEMYYLQSRYYDPMVGRFINADDVVVLGASSTVIGFNLFTYCENNPICKYDSTGMISASVTQTGYLKYRYALYFSDQDIRNIKLGIIVWDVVESVTLKVVGYIGAVFSWGISAAAVDTAIWIVNIVNGLALGLIDYYDYGKGATISFDFGFSSYSYYTPRYGWYRSFWGYRWGVIGLTRHTIYTPYLRSLPKLVWHK